MKLTPVTFNRTLIWCDKKQQINHIWGNFNPFGRSEGSYAVCKRCHFVKRRYKASK